MRPWQLKYLGISAIWGASFLFMMVGLRRYAPIQVSTTRVVAGALVLLLLSGVYRTRLPRDRHTWAHMQVSAFFLATLPYTLFAIAETRVTSALAGVGNATTPLATAALAAIFLRGHEVLDRVKLTGVVVGFAGVLIVLQPWATARPDPFYFALTIIAGISYGVGWVYNRRYLRMADLGGIAQPTAQLLAASAQLLVVLMVWWLSARDRVAVPWAPGAEHGEGSLLLPALAILALGVLGTGVAMAWSYDVVRAAGTTVNATTTYLVTVISTVLGILVLGEHVSGWQVLGSAVIIGSAAATQFIRRRA